MQEGLLWRVGDSRTVKIWNDRWVASPVTYSIQSTVQILDQETKVCALINEDTDWWNRNLVKSIFGEEEAAIMCGMVTSPNKQADQLVGLRMETSQSKVRIIWIT